MMVLALAACGETEETAAEATPAPEAAPAVDAAAPAVEGAASGEPAVEGAASGEPAEAAAPAEEAAPAAEGAASGEPAASGEAPADVPQSSAMTNEAHGGTAGATSDADYQAYLKAWLAYEQSVNTQMTDEQVNSEFIPLIEAGSYSEFPVEMMFSGMLTTGSAMTYDEFVAANGIY